MSDKEVFHMQVHAQDTRLAPATPDKPADAPEQHIGAQDPVPNAKLLQEAKRKETKTATQRPPPAVEHKAAEADDEAALYKTREARAKKAREPGATVTEKKT
jgi:hypothetical protein